MNTMDLFAGPLAQAIGWALLHLLWQASLAAAILAALLLLVPRQYAAVRYTISCSALALVFVMFTATAIRSWDPAAAPIDPAAYEETSASVPLAQLPSVIVATATESWKASLLSLAHRAHSSIPFLVSTWILGVALLSLRLLASWVRLRRLVIDAASQASAEYQQMAARLSAALGLPRAVAILESATVEVPSVLGWIKPVVLLPASTLSGLTPDQIQMVLAHELAHIRRHDFVVNLLQAVVETLMFYHPAVWWISSRVRIERENCCDDLALSICGDRPAYARALARLEELRTGSMPLALAANGGSLLERIRRIAAVRQEPEWNARWAAGLVMLAVLVISVTVTSVPALAQRDRSSGTVTDSAVDVVAAQDETSSRLASEMPDAEASAAADPDHHVDVDVDHDIEHDIGPDIDHDIDHDIDIDIDLDAEDLLAQIDVPMPVIAPRPAVAPLPSPAPAPAAPGRLAAPAPIGHAIAPQPPHGPLVMAQATAPRAPSGRRGLSDAEKLTVDDLIALRAVGVTPQLIEAMRALFPGISLDEVMGLSAVGATPSYIRQLRDAGYDLTVDEVQGMKALGVTTNYISRIRAIYPRLPHSEVMGFKALGITPEFIRELQSAGIDVSSADEVQGLKAVGVSLAYITSVRSMFPGATISQITGMKAVGVTTDYVREMRSAGFETAGLKEIQSLRAVGVSAGYLNEMKAAGVTIQRAEDAMSLRAVGVTPDFVRKLAAAGYTNLSVRELTSLAASGVNDRFVRDMSKYRSRGRD